MAAKIKNAVASFLGALIAARQAEVDRIIKANGWRGLQ